MTFLILLVLILRSTLNSGLAQFRVVLQLSLEFIDGYLIGNRVVRRQLESKYRATNSTLEKLLSVVSACVE